jgi:predicted nucleic acid-binding protein
VIVVSDTSPIRALKVVGLLAFLPRAYGQVLVPPEVAAELGVDVPGLGSVDIGALPGFSIGAVKDRDRMDQLLELLDLGEAAAIALAIEVRADLILVDEHPAREVVKRLGLKPLGALGVLVRAKELGEIASVRPLIDRLRLELNFRVSPQLLADVLGQVGES